MEREHGSPVPGIGRRLEEARKNRGLTLRQAEQATKVRSRYLGDLERGNFDILPSVYVLGSLRSYADFLGLDGASLARELKASLTATPLPEIPDQTTDEEDPRNEYEAGSIHAVGFDQLFLGMGIILISILAVMTMVAALTRDSEAPISQINEPSNPEGSPEIVFAASLEDRRAPQNHRADAASGAGIKRKKDGGSERDRPKDVPEAPRDDEGEGEDPSLAASLFGGVEFVPVSPSSPLESETDPAAGTSVASSASPTTVAPSNAAFAGKSSADAEPPAGASLTHGTPAAGHESDHAPAPPTGAPTKPVPPPAKPPPVVGVSPPQNGEATHPRPNSGVRRVPGDVPDAAEISNEVDRALEDVIPPGR